MPYNVSQLTYGAHAHAQDYTLMFYIYTESECVTILSCVILYMLEEYKGLISTL